MAVVVLGNLALILDITSPLSSHRTITVDRKTRPIPSDAVLSFFNNKKDYHHHSQVAAALSPEKRRGKAKVNAASSGDEEGEDEEEEEEREDKEEVSWEEEMRRRVREMEDMRELERMAEEMIRSRDEEERETEDEERESGGGGNEETEEDKRARVKRELQKVAKEQAERRKMAQLMFDLGQKAYGKGMYGRAVEFLEGSLTIIPRPTLFGGEIQIWLAMAYEANNRHADCIALYKKLETSHPSFGIRRQAAELRYILQAPKLKISQEEMVTIPLIGSSYDSYAGTWSDKNKDKDEKRYRSMTNQLSSDKDYLGDFLVWRPPTGWEKNRNFWIALTLWLSLAGAAVFLQN